MTIALKQLKSWLHEGESERLEFKEARAQFDADELTRYCVALANEHGGRILLGINDKRQVVGSSAFPNIANLKRDQSQRVRLNIEADEIAHPNGRVVVVTVPPRPIGMPIQYKGAYWMRRDESIVAMPPEVLRAIFDEAHPDHSAQICQNAKLDDLNAAAIDLFRTMWQRQSGNELLSNVSHRQLLLDAELIDEREHVTYAALILFGEPQAVARHLAQAETIFEYRSHRATIPYEQRMEFKQGFFLYFDKLWETINLRNEVFQYTDGLLRFEIPAVNEAVAREAILNAITHRDYRLSGSIFVRQFPKRLEVVSPGGLPPGITVENLLWRQAPRNRRLAEVFAKCGLVERAGQGANRMFEQSIRESKPLPDFSDSDDYQVSVVLNGEVGDENFLRFLEAVGRETTSSFATEHLLLLDLIHREQEVPERLKPALRALVDTGVVETVGRGRGVRYLLSRRFYRFAGSPGAYSRRRGLDRNTNKMLLLRHIQSAERRGCALAELQDVLPGLSRSQVQGLLRELRGDGDIHVVGRTRAARWRAGTA